MITLTNAAEGGTSGTITRGRQYEHDVFLPSPLTFKLRADITADAEWLRTHWPEICTYRLDLRMLPWGRTPRRQARISAIHAAYRRRRR